MTKGFILECKEEFDSSRPRYLYIPESEDLGPAYIRKTGDKYNPYAIEDSADAASERAVKEGESSAYKRIKEVEIPEEIIKLIEAHRNYKEKMKLASPKIDDFLVRD